MAAWMAKLPASARRVRPPWPGVRISRAKKAQPSTVAYISVRVIVRGVTGGGGRTEEEDGGQRFEPAVGARDGLGRGAQGEENGVAGLHADERGPGVVAGGVGEAGDEGGEEEGEGG